jgi:putative ABC transport system permease protein
MLAKDPRILSIGASAAYPGIENGSDQLLYREGKSVNSAYDVKLNYTDFDFLRTLGVERLAGRLFTDQFPADSVNGIVVNEQAVRVLGYTDANAVGKKLYNSFQGQTQSYHIVGVVKDFHFADLHVAISPYGVLVSSVFNQFNYMIVHLSPGDPAPLISSLGQAWKQVDPAEPFEYTFLDQEFQKNYDADNRLATLVSYFTAIAIAISCLGLFGLAAFSAEQRTKEIGVRKVLGASSGSIVQLLSRDFVRLVIAGFVIATPIGWWAMHKWLEGYAYKVPLSWWMFALAGVLALAIALFTVSFQAFRAARANPVKSLRSE